MNEETTASLGNTKKNMTNHNYFGIIFNKNQTDMKPQSVKRSKELTKIMNVKNISSPHKHISMINSNELNGKRRHKILKSGEATYIGASINYAPKIINKEICE